VTQAVKWRGGTAIPHPPPLFPLFHSRACSNFAQANRLRTKKTQKNEMIMFKNQVG
jgi:hypothetical protein